MIIVENCFIKIYQNLLLKSNERQKAILYLQQFHIGIVLMGVHKKECGFSMG